MNLNFGDESTFYDILEVDPRASGKEIYNAYLTAKDTYSPDSPALYSMFSPDEARQLLRLIEEAYGVLSNQARRQQYDESLARRGIPGFEHSLKSANKSESPSKGWAPSVMSTLNSGTKTSLNDEAGVVRTQVNSREDTLPEGFSRTRFGIYEVNPRLEEELSRLNECDGAFIQRIRQYKQVSLDQLSEVTKISKSYIAAVEANALNALPAAVFVRGFVAQIARALGVNDKMLADAYMKFYRNPNRGS